MTAAVLGEPTCPRCGAAAPVDEDTRLCDDCGGDGWVVVRGVVMHETEVCQYCGRPECRYDMEGACNAKRLDLLVRDV